MICLPAEVEAFNSEGAIVRLPVRGRKEPVELNSKKLPGSLRAAGPGDVNPADFDLVALAMQEPQYRSPGVRELLDAVATSRKPCMSIMNMPPLPYLKRIPGLDTEKLKAAFTDPSVWDNFEPGRLTLCSPDPQAIRPPGEKINVLRVTLPTNFKVARFDSDESTNILRQMERDIEAARHNPGDGEIQLPVKLKVHDSIFVPLAKWAMLLSGNYRCVTKDGAIDIKDAVHRDIEESRSVYNWVVGLCEKLGASANDLVPFEKYAAAANDLVRPSSAARALNNGVPNIERTDRLVQLIGQQLGVHHPVVDRTVALVDERLGGKRQKGAEGFCLAFNRWAKKRAYRHDRRGTSLRANIAVLARAECASLVRPTFRLGFADGYPALSRDPRVKPGEGRIRETRGLFFGDRPLRFRRGELF